MRSAWILALVALTAFAGCLDDESSADATDDMADAAPMALGTLAISESGMIMLGTEDAVNAQCGLAGEGVDTAVHTFEVPADVNGTAAVAKALTLTLTMAETGLDLDLYLLDADGNELASSSEFNVQGTNTETVEVASLPAGTYTVEVRSCTGVAASYTLEGGAELVAA